MLSPNAKLEHRKMKDTEMTQAAPTPREALVLARAKAQALEKANRVGKEKARKAKSKYKAARKVFKQAKKAAKAAEKSARQAAKELKACLEKVADEARKTSRARVASRRRAAKPHPAVAPLRSDRPSSTADAGPSESQAVPTVPNGDGNPAI